MTWLFIVGLLIFVIGAFARTGPFVFAGIVLMGIATIIGF